MTPFHLTGDALWERMDRADERVRQRLELAANALENAGIGYAIAGESAVHIWVARADEAAVRTTRDVDLLVRRSDFDAVKSTLEAAGFIYRHVKSIDMFLDGADAKARDAVHILYGGEKIGSSDLLPAPDVDQSLVIEQHRTLELPALVQMKLTSYRDKDRTHLRDMIDVGLIDETWPARYPAELSARLQMLLDDPEG